MAEKLYYYCETCDVHLTGQQPAMQHYDGSKHKKKEALKSAQNTTLFSAATDRSTGVNYSTAAIVSDFGKRADSLDLSGSTSACSSELTKSESFLKAAETAPRYNVVMVPPLNPALPPVAVTMTENVLPQLEYEFDGSSGSCCICGVQLTSQQHADQHLTGQKHLKAKKKWEMRHEQLQMTVSGLSPSMKSKPIAMCQPLVCEPAARYCVSSVSDKHSSDRPNPSMMCSGPATAKSVNMVDGMQWFTCDVCNKKMNTFEMLELHQRSPAHLKKVEQQQQQQQQQFGSVPGDNTVWQLCSVCHKKLNSPAQLEIHMNSHNRPSTMVNQAACAEDKVVPVVVTAGTQWHYSDICNKYMDTTPQLQHHLQSPAHLKKTAPSYVFGDNTAWQICPVCAKRLNSVQQLDIHIKSHGLPTGSLLNDLPMNTVVTETQITSSNPGTVFRNVNMTSLAAEMSYSSVELSQKVEVDMPNLLVIADQVQLQEGISQEALSHDDRSRTSLQNLDSQTISSAEINSSVVAYDEATGGDDENCASSKEFSQKVDVTNLLMLVNPVQLLEGISQEAVKTNSVDLSCDDSQITSIDVINSAVVADNGATGDDKNSDSVSENQSTFGCVCAEDDNVLSPATSQADVDNGSLAAADDAGDDADEKLITDDDLVTTGCCTSVGCFFHCELCDVHLNSDDSRTMHLTGTKHRSCRQKAEEAMPAEHNRFGPSFRYFCQLCNVPFNTLRDKIQHDRGQQHTSKSVRRLQAPERLLPLIIVPIDVNEVSCTPDSLVTSKPRLYQEELYYKALLADSICFLPTGRVSARPPQDIVTDVIEGTGKTLVAVMMMSHLLTLNPHHSVVFVVDRILLALQQSRVIRKELGDKLFNRWNEQLKVIEQRKLRVAMLCGAKSDLHGANLCEQDIIVITAAYYVNLLETGSLRWSDNCLVVIDEVHHCLKDHPYSRLIQMCHHSQLEVGRRPRLLGLTASPAGRDTAAGTTLMLRQLLSNLGIERLVAVERNVDELARYRSTAMFDIRLITYSCSEKQLGSEIRRYILQCYLRLSELSGVTSPCDLDVLSSLSPDNLEDAASGLDQEVVQCLTDVVDAAEPNDPSCKLVVSFLKTHLKVICQALEALESMGLENTYNELAILMRPDNVASFSHAEEAGLPCAALKTLVAGYLEAENRPTATDDDAAESMKKSTTYIQLVQELETWLESQTHSDGGQQGMALVLVRKRMTATNLSQLLGCCASLQQRHARVVHVVGHGSGGAERGLTFQQQARTLEDIRAGKYNVIVATAVAEEGVDLPDCDLVVQLDAPDCVRALVQVRGRARKAGSRFVAFCHDTVQKTQLNALLLQEQHMIDAISQMIYS